MDLGYIDRMARAALVLRVEHKVLLSLLAWAGGLVLIGLWLCWGARPGTARRR